MTEERKYAILFSATILAARKLAEIGDKPCPAREASILFSATILPARNLAERGGKRCPAREIRNAERILQKIDERWPTEASDKTFTS